MYVILEYSLIEKVPKFLINNSQLPLVRPFMDNINLLSYSVFDAKTLYHQYAKALK